MSDWREKLNQLHKEFEGGYAEDKIVELEYALFEFEKEIYNKAIGVFMNTALELIRLEQDTRYGYLDGKDIRDIAEQLKVGGKNEK